MIEYEKWDGPTKVLEDLKVSCSHKSCPRCKGTGKQQNGSICIHHLSCRCPKCTPKF